MHGHWRRPACRREPCLSSRASARCVAPSWACHCDAPCCEHVAGARAPAGLPRLTCPWCRKLAYRGRCRRQCQSERESGAAEFSGRADDMRAGQPVEAALTAELAHPNIVRLLAHATTPASAGDLAVLGDGPSCCRGGPAGPIKAVSRDELWLLLEFCNRGTLGVRGPPPCSEPLGTASPGPGRRCAAQAVRRACAWWRACSFCEPSAWCVPDACSSRVRLDAHRRTAASRQRSVKEQSACQGTEGANPECSPQ